MIISLVPKGLKKIFDLFGYGGGKIKRKLLFMWALLLFSYVAISGCSFAADNAQTTINGNIYTAAQIQDATNRVNTFQETYNRLPNYVTISGQKIPINDFLPYMEKTSTTTNEGTVNTVNNSIIINGVTYTNAQIQDATSRVNTFKATYNRLPTYVTISGQKILINDFLPYMETTSTAAASTSNNNTQSNNTQSTNINQNGTTFTIAQIYTAATTVKQFYDTNNRLPNYVTINNIQVTMPSFLQLLTHDLLNIYNGLTTSVTLKIVTGPSNPTESIANGNLYKSEYISIAQNIKKTIETNGSVPNFIDSSLGKIRYESLIYTFSKILIYQKTNNRLPNYVTISEGSSINSSTTSNSSTSSSMEQYLIATTNAQSTSSTIINLANSITAGLTTEYEKAQAIFNWVRDNISYSFYSNSQKGALGTLSSKTANCCDHSHLVVALARAAGIPARYQHGYCYYDIGGFVGWYGHVWAQLYVNGKWYYADACDNSTPFGVINAWNLNTYTLYGSYATLPF